MELELSRKIEGFVETSIVEFHQARASALARLDLDTLLLAKNPYLFRAKNLDVAADLIGALLDARLSSSEEGLFGHFMEELAIFVAGETCGGKKSGIPGIDLELERGGIRYLIAIKSGKNWGNASQHGKLRENFKTAVKVLRQSKQSGQLQPTLGICYGRFPKKDSGLYLHIGGQQFWELISGDDSLYSDLVEPIGHQAKLYNEDFSKQRAAIANTMTAEFLARFCYSAGHAKAGQVNWQALLELVSKNVSVASKSSKRKTPGD